MASITDYPHKPGLLHAHDAAAQPKKRRFRLFAALAAPFRDMDERALHKKGKQVEVRNNSKGNMFNRRELAPAKVPVRAFPRGND
ncbi:MAG TPA: hypothetical protein VM782_10270 [Stellaceae bacterium]|nr:hypothetical protein [Stellaceae bacterium]